MIKRSATFTNVDDNINLVINDLSPDIVINTIDGIYEFVGEVMTSPYSQTSGDRYKTTRAPKRNIVVEGIIYNNFYENRQLMYRVFRLGSVGRFCYSENGRDNRYADYYVESIDIDQDAYRGAYQISLICPDPFFYDATPKNIVQVENNVETRINEYLDPDSVFFQLRAGINTIGYNAASGAANLNVHIEYKMRYLGV